MAADPRLAWSSPPVDDVGYVPSSELLALSDGRLRNLIEKMEKARYGGWRNYLGRWRDVLGLDSTHGKDVLDFGCGVGLESLQYAKTGNRVVPSDIVIENVELSIRVLRLFGFPAASPSKRKFDVIHCSGCLHHIPDPVPVVERFAFLLRSGGEVRLMVYSDEAWRIATKTEPPDDVTTHPDFQKYVRTWDAVGDYADWYDRDRLERRFGDLFTIQRCEYLTERREYLGAVLARR